MYNVMDSYLQVGTWYSLHPLDEKRFFVALNNIIDDPKFSAEDMGSYMYNYFNLNPNDDDNAFVKTIRRLISKATTIKDFLDTVSR